MLCILNLAVSTNHHMLPPFCRHRVRHACMYVSRLTLFFSPLLFLSVVVSFHNFQFRECLLLRFTDSESWWTSLKTQGTQSVSQVGSPRCVADGVGDGDVGVVSALGNGGAINSSSKKAATSDVPQDADSLVHRIIRMITDDSSASKRILALLPKDFRHVIPIIKMIFDSSSFLQDQVQDQVKEMEDAELALRLLIDENRNAVGTWRETNKIMFDANALAAYRSGMEPFLEVIESGVQILKGVARGEEGDHGPVARRRLPRRAPRGRARRRRLR